MANTAATLAILVKANTTVAKTNLRRMDAQMNTSRANAERMVTSTDKVSESLERVGVNGEKATTQLKAISNVTPRAGRNAEKSSKNFSSLARGIVVANQAASLFGKTLSLLKWPAIIAGSGTAAQAISALTAGVVGLTGALVPASGAVVEYGTVLTTFGQVAAVKALSGLKDVGAAVGGLTTKIDKQSTAWKKLSPQAQGFAEQIDKIQSGPLSRIQKAVQKPLFASLTKSVREAKDSLPAFKQVLTGTSQALGGIAERMGKFVGSKAFSSDFKKVGGENNKVLARMGRVMTNLSHALMDLLVAARPLTEWITKGIVSWSQWVKQSTQAARANGDLARFFGQTRNVLHDLVSMVSDLGAGLMNILKLGQPLGNQVLDKLVEASQAFRDWTESAKGQNAIAQWFKDAKGPLFEMGRLIHDIVIDFFKLGQSGALDQMLRMLRTQLLPVLFHVAKSTSKAFGPNLIRLLTQVGRLIGTMAGVTGPLNLYVQALTAILKTINDLFKAHPELAKITAGFIEFAAVLKTISFVGALTGITRLTTAFRGLAVAEGAATVAAGGGLLGKFGLARAAPAVAGAEGLNLVAGGTAAGIGGGTVAGIGAGALMGGLGIKGTVQDIMGGGIGTAAKKAAMFSVLGPGALVGRSLRELPMVGDAIGGVEDKVSSLAHHVPVVGDAFDTVFGSGGDVPAAIKDSLDALGKTRDQTRKTMKTLKRTGVDTSGSVGDAFQHLKEEYGTVAQAGLFMSQKQRKAYMDMARGAHKSGEISDHWFRHIKKVIGGSIHGIAHDIKGGNKVIDSMGDIVHRLGNKTIPQAVKKMTEKYGGLVAAGHAMSGKQREAFMDVAKQAHDLGLISDKQFSNITDSLSHNSKRWNDMMRKAAEVTGQSQKSMRKSVGDTTVSISKSYDGMVRVTGNGLNWLTSNTSRAAQSLGIKKEVKFHTSPAATGAGHFGHRQATGGVVPGHGQGDKVPVTALTEPGEGLFVLNKNAMGALKSMNAMFPRHQGGGFAGMQPEISSLAKFFLNKFGGYMSSGFRPGDDGFHGRGLAADIVPGDWRAASAYANKIGPQLLEGIYNPGDHGGTAVSWDSGNRVSPSFWGSATWAQHLTHIHMATIGAVKAAQVKLKRLLLNGPDGALKDTGQAALDKVWKAGQGWLKKNQGSMMGTDVALPSGSLSKTQMRKLLRAHNMPDIMGWIALAESSWNPQALGHDPGGTTGYGLWQITSGYNDALIRRFSPILDPNNNAEAAMQLYNASGTSPWNASRGNWGSHVGQKFTRGGIVKANSIPWFKNGADFEARRRMVIGVGDRPGGERVQVSPLSHSSQPSTHVHTHVHVEPGSGADMLEDMVRSYSYSAVDEAMDELDSFNATAQRAGMG